MDPISVIIAIVVVALIIDTIYLNLDCQRQTIRFPIIGDLPYAAWHYNDFNDYSSSFHENGKDMKPVTFVIGRDRLTGVVHPKDVEHILKANWKNYSISKGVRGDSLAELLGNGIFHADGECWYTQRKTVTREFTVHNFKTFMLHEFLSSATSLANILIKAAAANETVDLHSLFFKLTLDAFGKIGFGVNFGGLHGSPIPFAHAFDMAQEISVRRILTKPPWLWKMQRWFGVGSEHTLRKHLSVMDQFVDDLIATREKDEKVDQRLDLFSRLFSISESEQDKRQRHQYLRDMTVNFMIAGRDTTACALSWLVWEVSQHPEIERKLVDEIQDCIPTATPSFDDLAKCHYLMAVIHESLRLHPSVASDTKYVVADDVLPSNGSKVRAGQTVVYLPYCMARIAALWGPDAKAFNPERWLSVEDGTFQRADVFKYPVFQAGPRMCLGIEMALLEMKAVVVTLYRKMTFHARNVPRPKTSVVLQMQPPGLQVTIDVR